MPLPSVGLKFLSEQEPLDRYTSFKIGGAARYFARPRTTAELKEALDFARAEELPTMVLGGGCNTLVRDGGFAGLVIHTGRLNEKVTSFRLDTNVLKLPAGYPIPQIGRLCRDYELGGLEFLSQIPGTVGGAVVMNAGFSRFGDRSESIGPWVDSVTVVTPGGELKVLSREELSFFYRSSNLIDVVVVDVTLKLRRSTRERIDRDMKLNYEYRISVQDLRHPSAGSVFKNPEGSPLSVGQMIDRIGLKGKAIGGAQISERHGNWIGNTADARSRDVEALIECMRDEVKRYFGIELETEIRVVGES